MSKDTRRQVMSVGDGCAGKGRKLNYFPQHMHPLGSLALSFEDANNPLETDNELLFAIRYGKNELTCAKMN